ncbi:alpha/beta fold hydrolase [Alkalihalophilus sp. As8PL]|uniref:Alpha/beta fold hydrolase n=1 Tax=Alkalihalophilus sp. As8PL TaxID=3237103 RepID=A0AB39BU78_9BACI
MRSIEFMYIKTNGITLHTALAGPENGPLVILLHGFPEYWYGWRHQIEALGQAGYRVVVPDQRGYNLSEKPKLVEEYKLDTLRDDIIGLIESLGYKKAMIVGHDWGGVIAWHLASSKPDYVDKLIILNSPHPAEFNRKRIYFPKQWMKSLYILFFQAPLLPEKFLQANEFNLMKKSLVKTSFEGAFSKKDLDEYSHAWSRPTALTSMLNWYRAIKRGTFAQVNTSLINVPVRVLWGYKDSFLSLKLAKQSVKRCTKAELILVEGTHWVHHEKPHIINELMIKYLSEG